MHAAQEATTKLSDQIHFYSQQQDKGTGLAAPQPDIQARSASFSLLTTTASLKQPNIQGAVGMKNKVLQQRTWDGVHKKAQGVACGPSNIKWLMKHKQEDKKPASPKLQLSIRTKK